ncbi:DNA-processing protein DprA [Shouchella lonarensis]|nr:DNA-processing protein DprA [Shouchella lonarensis]
MSSMQLQTLLAIPKQRADAFYKHLQQASPEQTYKHLHAQRIQPLTLFDEHYPLLLKTIYDPPYVLYTKGDVHLLATKMLAIVGARKPTSYAHAALRMCIPMLAKHQVTIVSGLARGVDRFAHELSLEYGTGTVAVVGSGFQHVYPPEHVSLFRTLAKKHLVVSEYPPMVSPQKWHFPMRNRIISGLALGVLLIEARERSGSLITADQALEQGREVMAIPGPITSRESVGTNHLIQQGAHLVRQAEDIFFACPQLSNE